MPEGEPIGEALARTRELIERYPVPNGNLAFSSWVSADTGPVQILVYGPQSLASPFGDNTRFVLERERRGKPFVPEEPPEPLDMLVQRVMVTGQRLEDFRIDNTLITSNNEGFRKISPSRRYAHDTDVPQIQVFRLMPAIGVLEIAELTNQAALRQIPVKRSSNSLQRFRQRLPGFRNR